MTYDQKVVEDCMEYAGLERKILDRLRLDPNLSLSIAPVDLEKDYDHFQKLHEIIYGPHKPFSSTEVAQQYCVTFFPKR